MTLPANKTKIVCTIGPASESPQVLERMIRAGMNVARINFSHGDVPGHKKVIKKVRAAARKAKTILQNSEVVVAIEIIAACQALDFRKPLRHGRGP